MSCDGGSPQAPEAASVTTAPSSASELAATPTSTPTPTPTPTPMPMPMPTPTPRQGTGAVGGDGRIVVVTEGSSSAVSWDGSHTGMFGNSRNDIEYHGLAVGGSDIETLHGRIDAVLALEPDLVSIYIGSNDLQNFSSAQDFAVELEAYVDILRAEGAKVVISTLLPRQVAGTDNATYNAMRLELAEIVKAADWVDGVADFANDPQMGPDDAPFNTVLYQADGLHPTAGANRDPATGQMVLFEIYRPAMDALVEDAR